MIQEYSDTEYPEFWVQDGARLSEFKELFGEHYAFSEERDAFDYVYNRADLASLSGQKIPRQAQPYKRVFKAI